MANIFIFIPSGRPWTDPVTSINYRDGQIHLFDNAITSQIEAANRAIAAGAAFDVSALVSSLIQISWANVTGKPSSFTPSVHQHSAGDITSGEFADPRISESSVTQHQGALTLLIAQITGLQQALDALIASSEKGAANGVATLDANSTLPLVQIPLLSASQTTSGVFNTAQIPDLDWSKILEATRPNTLAGYGITDALTETQIGQQIQAAIADLIGGAPEALNTLAELAEALGDNPDAVANLTNAVASKLDASLWQAATAAVDGFMSKEDKAKLDGIEAGATGDMTGAEIKTAYEGEADTNAFTDAEKTKLGGIAVQATKNASDAALRDRSTHTGTQAQSTIDGLVQALADRLLRSELPFASLAHFTSTDDVTDMAAGATVKWNSTLMSDSAISIGGANNTDLSVAEAGRYLISVRLVYADTSAEGVDVNNTLGASISVNGVSVGRQGVGSPVLNTDGANEGQVVITEPLDLEPGDVVTVQVQRLSGGDALYLIPGQSSLLVERKGGKSAALAAQGIPDITGLAAALAELTPKKSDTAIFSDPETYGFVSGAKYYRRVGRLYENNGQLRVFGTLGGHIPSQGRATVDLNISIRDGLRVSGAIYGKVGTAAWFEIRSNYDASGLSASPYDSYVDVYLVRSDYYQSNVQVFSTGSTTGVVPDDDWTLTVPSDPVVWSLATYDPGNAGVRFLGDEPGDQVSLFAGNDQVLTEGTFTPRDHPYLFDMDPDSAYTATPIGAYVVEMSAATEPGWPKDYTAGLHIKHSDNRQGQLCIANDTIYTRRAHLSNTGGVGTGWAPWRMVWTDANFDPSTKADTDHGHEIEDVNGLDDTLTALATLPTEVLLTADTLLNDTNAPAGRLIRVKAGAAPGARITLTIPDDAPQGWRRTILVSDGVAEFNFGNNTLTVDGAAVPPGDTPVITAGRRATLIADTAGNLVRY